MTSLNSISFGLLLFLRCIMIFTQSSSIKYSAFAVAQTINALHLPIESIKRREKKHLKNY